MKEDLLITAFSLEVYVKQYEPKFGYDNPSKRNWYSMIGLGDKIIQKYTSSVNKMLSIKKLISDLWKKRRDLIYVLPLNCRKFFKLVCASMSNVERVS